MPSCSNRTSVYCSLTCRTKGNANVERVRIEKIKHSSIGQTPPVPQETSNFLLCLIVSVFLRGRETNPSCGPAQLITPPCLLPRGLMLCEGSPGVHGIQQWPPGSWVYVQLLSHTLVLCKCMSWHRTLITLRAYIVDVNKNYTYQNANSTDRFC